MKKISFVIPCYRSEKTIRSVVDEVIATVTARYDYQIILVNDSSPDDTFNELKKLGEENRKITVIDLAKNFGQHNALLAGFHYVEGDVVVCLDDDGQTPANQMFLLLDKLSECDVAVAKYPEKKHSFFRNFGSKVNDLMARFFIGKPKELSFMSYFACKRYVIDEIIKYENAYPYIAGLILRTTDRVLNVSVSHRERQEGNSGYTFKKLFRLWLNGFTAFSVKPLRVASMFGCIFSVIGFVYGVIIILRRLFNPDMVMGYSSTMAAILFIGGLILIMQGLLGEYVGRSYICMNRSPQFVIREVINKDEE